MTVPSGPEQFLLLARYTAQSWQRWQSFSKSQQDRARNLALTWFPIEGKKLEISADGSVDIPEIGSVRFLQTFHTRILEQIEQIKEQYPLPEYEEGPDVPPVEEIEQPNEDYPLFAYAMAADDPHSADRTTAIGKLYDAAADTMDPGIGWIAIVDAAQCEKLLGKYWTSPFWQLFEIQIIPLNSDPTTHEFYFNMTPINWRT